MNVMLKYSVSDLPSELFGFNGGFSCKSFSRLHNDWQQLQRAMHDENMDSWIRWDWCGVACNYAK